MLSESVTLTILSAIQGFLKDLLQCIWGNQTSKDKTAVDREGAGHKSKNIKSIFRD